MQALRLDHDDRPALGDRRDHLVDRGERVVRGQREEHAAQDGHDVDVARAAVRRRGLIEYGQFHESLISSHGQHGLKTQ